MHPVLTTDLVHADTARRSRAPRWGTDELREHADRAHLARDAERLARRAARLQARAARLERQALALRAAVLPV